MAFGWKNHFLFYKLKILKTKKGLCFHRSMVMQKALIMNAKQPNDDDVGQVNLLDL